MLETCIEAAESSNVLVRAPFSFDTLEINGSSPQPPWLLALGAANQLRHRLGVPSGPIRNTRLSEIVGTNVECLKTKRRSTFDIPYALRLRQETGSRLALRSTWSHTRRFELCRSLGDIIWSRDDAMCPLSAAKSERQKYQRAFAQGFLCPFADLQAYIDTDEPGQSTIRVSQSGKHARLNLIRTLCPEKVRYRDTGLAPRQLLSVHSSDREPAASESPMTERSKSVNSNRRWKRITQLSIITVPFVMVALYYFSPPEKGSEGNPPTGVLVRPPDPIASTIAIPKPETEPTEPVESAQTEIQTVKFEIETRERTVERHFQNGHCENSTNIKWEVRAAEGWRIDVTSLKLAPVSISSKSSYFGVSDLTEDGFTMNGRVSNNGDCVTVLGKVVARDGRGRLTVAGRYNEKREVEVPNEG